MNALRAILEWVRAILKRLRTILKWVWTYVIKFLPEILVVLLIGLLAVFVIVGVVDPAWIYCFFGMEKGTGTGKFRILEFIGVGMGGVLLAIGATIANRRAKAMEETNKGAEDGRRQERLKNAIEHLGHESDSVHLGGAYELFHLAQDTEDDDLRRTVLDILCAHIRRTTGKDRYREEHKSKPSEEIQGLLTLLFAREHAVFKGCRIDLRESWLNGVDLPRAHLQEVDISRAHLQGATLVGTRLQKATLIRAQLQGADLRHAQLQRANLFRAQLQRAKLFRAQLQGANLTRARLQGAILFSVRLQGAHLPGARLQGVSLFRAQLQKAFLLGAYLQGANFREAQLQGADLDEAQLQGANLLGTHLKGANLGGAQLQGATSKSEAKLSFKERICQGINQETDQTLISRLPEGSGAITGAYTKEEAERWIAEYEEAMRGVPKAEG